MKCHNIEFKPAALMAAAALVILLVLPLSFAIPGVPNQFYGSVTINNAPAPVGTSVTASINGATAGSTTTSGGSYNLIVEDPDNINSGKTVLLFVQGVQAASSVFGNGKVTQLDLTVVVSSFPAGNTPSGSSSSSGGGGGGASSTSSTSPNQSAGTTSGGNGNGGTAGTNTTPASSAVCEEKWVCDPWSECIGGRQARKCLDENLCGTEKDKPLLAQPCASEKMSAAAGAGSPALQSAASGGITGMFLSMTSTQGLMVAVLGLIVIYAAYHYLRQTKR